MKKAANTDRGFTLIEGAIVILGIGIVIAVSVPRITGAMRQYRLNMATRQVVDTLRRAKMQAASENMSVAMAVDPGGRRSGLAFLDDAGNVIRTEYLPLPDGVDFQEPPDINQAPDGKAIDGPLSFDYDNKAKAHLQVFDSRGFPSVDFGDEITILIGNGRDYNAVTMTSVGGVRTFTLENSEWKDTRDDYTAGRHADNTSTDGRFGEVQKPR